MMLLKSSGVKFTLRGRAGNSHRVASLGCSAGVPVTLVVLRLDPVAGPITIVVNVTRAGPFENREASRRRRS
jgi:hypothetical protein